MPRLPTRIIVLVEDTEQQNLIWRHLESLGVSRGKVDWRPLPNGRGSAEQYVREQFPAQVEALRSAMGHKVLAILIAMVDADSKTVAQRRAELGAAEPSQRVSALIPKRHVETWLCALNGQGVDEESDYHGQFSGTNDIKAAAKALSQWLHGSRMLAGPPSLLDSKPEWEKIG